MRFNELLERQIKKYLPEDDLKQEHLIRFIQAVHDSYEQYEKDRNLREVKVEHASIQKLKETITTFMDTKPMVQKDANDLSGVIAFLEHELDEKKKADKSLKRSEKRLRLALQTIDDNVWEYHFPTRTMTFALNERSILDLHKTEYCGKENLKWWQAIVEEDRYIAIDTFRKYNNGEITKHCVEYRVRKSDGTVKWVLNRGGVIRTAKNGKPITVIGTLTDIHNYKTIQINLKREEEKYRSIIANMNLGLIEVDLNEKIRYVNHSFCNMSGYEEHELTGKKASDLFPGDKFKQFIKGKHNLSTTGQSDAYEMNVKTKNDDNRWWLVSGAPLYNDKHQLTGSIGIYLDITQQKLLAGQLLEAKFLAEKSAYAKDIFLANMSHEIRTPMNAIVGMSKQLLKTTLSPQQQSLLDIIGTAADHLLVIINDILDFSKLDAGKLTLEEIGFNMHDLVHHTSRVLKLKAEEKGLIFDLHISDDIAPVLKGDPYRINQVLMNLLSNSIKFTHRGMVSLKCLLKNNLPDKQVVEIIVNDTGKGMDESFLKNIFSKFRQEDESIARSYGGTGLGMSIVKQLVDLMNGTIAVNSKKGEGTTVSITLSFLICSEGDLPKKDNSQVQIHTLAGKKILLVEDNHMNQMVAETILKQYDAAIYKAVNGAEAVEAIRSSQFDIVLMDIQMPVMDGFEATQIIRKELHCNVPIIALTANAVKGEMEKCIKAGMNDYLSKPFEEEDLIRLIAQWLGRQQPDFTHTKEKRAPDGNLYDLAKLRQITKGDEQFVSKMLQLFIQETPASLNELDQAFEKKDIKKVKFLAHRMKSSLANLGITSAAGIAKKMEVTEWTEQDHRELEGMIVEFKLIINEVIPLLQAECMQLTP